MSYHIAELVLVSKYLFLRITAFGRQRRTRVFSVPVVSLSSFEHPFLSSFDRVGGGERRETKYGVHRLYPRCEHGIDLLVNYEV